VKILGISAHYHDAAAALVVDGVPVAAVQEERLSRRKHDASFPLGAIEWCLERGGLEPEDLDAVVFYERSMLKFARILTCALRAFPRSWRSFPHAMKNSLGEKVWARGIISSHLGIGREKISSPGTTGPRGGVLTSPSRRAITPTALVVGGAHGRHWSPGRDPRPLGGVRFPHSLSACSPPTFTAYSAARSTKTSTR
jgi:carbamoyltransferase